MYVVGRTTSDVPGVHISVADKGRPVHPNDTAEALGLDTGDLVEVTADQASVGRAVVKSDVAAAPRRPLPKMVTLRMLHISPADNVTGW